MRVLAGAKSAVVGATLALAGGDAVAAPASCKSKLGGECVVTVPLDRAGTVPGSVRLRVERRLARGATRPPLLMLSGSAGESSLDRVLTGIDHSLSEAVGKRDIVAMDLRGTGRSGVLRCPELERSNGSPTAAVGRCAASLGPRRGFYTARDSAQDVEAVRQALGIERIALLGSSYGAQVAFAYAQRYPDRVDRLVLDSIFGPLGFDSLYRPGFAAVPQTVQVLCRKNRCHRASGDPLADVTELAQRLERGPMTGKVIGRSGRPRAARWDSFELFELLQAAVSGERSVMGIVHNAVRGDRVPLLRLGVLSTGAPRGYLRPVASFSPAAYAASMCEEAQLPWSRSAPLGERDAQAAAFVRALPPGSLLPFGPRAALGSDILELCRRWPIASVAPDSPKPLPPIPTLIVAGVDDVLAPVSSARAVANLIPGARLLRLRGAGHGVFDPEGGGGGSCAGQVLGEFLAGTLPKGVCGPEWKSYRGASAPPLSLAEVAPDPRVSGRAGRTLTAINATIRDGGEIVKGELLLRFLDLRSAPRRQWKRILTAPARIGGLRRGAYALSLVRRRLVLRGASYVPGVRVTGSVLFAQQPAKRRGVLRVEGPGAARGTLVLRRGVLTGTLGGREVRAPTRWGPDAGLWVQ